MAVVANRAPVRVSGGLIPVTVECRFDRECTGALLVTLDTTELGRSDLSVPAKGSRVIGVPLSPAGRNALARGARGETFVTLDVGPSWMALSQAERKKWLPVEVGEIRVAR